VCIQKRATYPYPTSHGRFPTVDRLVELRRMLRTVDVSSGVYMCVYKREREI